MMQDADESVSASRDSWDAVVIGAGPAGSAAALELAQSGSSVLLVDKARFPRAKVCGSCLNQRAVDALRRLGLGGVVDEGVPLRTIRLRYGKHEAELPLPGGVSLSRRRLDAALAAAAGNAGAKFFDETIAAIGPVISGRRRVQLHRHAEQREASTTLVLAATGLGGIRFSGRDELRPLVHRTSRIGAGALCPEAPGYYGPGTVYMACSAHGYLGMVRLEDGQLDLAAALDLQFARKAGGPAQAAAAILDEAGWPALPGIEQLDWHGTPALTRWSASPAAERLLLLGDAAGYVEPFTGEGIAWALETAHAAAPLAGRAIRASQWQVDFEREWSDLHAQIVGRSQRTCRFVTSALRHPAAVRLIVQLLSHAPALAAPILRRVYHG